MACVISSPFSTSVGAVAGGGAGRTALRQAQNTRGVVQKCYGVAVAGANAGAATTRAGLGLTVATMSEATATQACGSCVVWGWR